MSDPMTEEWYDKRNTAAAAKLPRFDFPRTVEELKKECPIPAAKPSYYAIPAGCVDIGGVVEHLPFWVANAMKYLYRVDGKDVPVSNLEKAIECINREIARRNKDGR